MPDEPTLPVTIIEATSGWVSLRLNELWEYRELVSFLTWREIKVRYTQTLLGIAWAVIQPLFSMLIFSLFFGRLAKLPSEQIPYPLFCLAGLVPWTFFSNGLTQASNSVVANSNLISKVYFPRLAIPSAAVLSGTIDLGISFVLLLGFLPFFHPSISWHIVFLPLFFVLEFAATLGASLWLSALNVEYRDVRHAVPFLTQLWMFATPIVYPSTLLPGRWRTLYGLNPLVGVVEGFRWSLLGTNSASGSMIALSTLASLALLIGGAFYFRRMENTFADIV